MVTQCIRDKLQIVQNTALRIATGCTHDTNTQYLHDETNVLPIHQHLQLHASQIRQKAQHPTHPLHKLTIHPHTPRLKNEAEFRIIIGDEIVTHTVYGHRKFRKDSIIMPFKMYRSNSTPIRHHGMSNQEESRNQKREMRDRQRDQPAADSRVTMDRQIHQPAADTLLPRPANTNVDPVIPGSKRHSLQAVELCKLCRTSPPPAMGARLPFFCMPAMRTRWMAGAAAHKSG